MLRPPHCVPGPGTCTSFESGSDPRIHGSAGLSDQLAFVCKSTPFEKPLILAASSTKAKLFIDVRVSGWVSPSLARPQEGRDGERDKARARACACDCACTNVPQLQTKRHGTTPSPKDTRKQIPGQHRPDAMQEHKYTSMLPHIYICIHVYIYIYMYMYC